jgi:uncharacterized protein YaiI (UPF0178 family)
VKIWVDADACPVPIREVIVRAANRLNVDTVFVANKPVALPAHPHLSFVPVERGSDIADAYILANAGAGDLVITQDIPLAAQLVPGGITVISPRGDSYNADNIGDVLASRNLMQDLRDSGTITGGPAPFDEKLKRKFSSLFDAALHKLNQRSGGDGTR